MDLRHVEGSYVNFIYVKYIYYHVHLEDKSHMSKSKYFKNVCGFYMFLKLYI